MDTFKDKIAQRLNAQEIIKANAEAEEKENNRLRNQLNEYDERIREIRQLNLKTQELTEDLEKMISANKNVDAETLEQVHKECVKVYRNVQAVVELGFKNQGDEIQTQTKTLKKRMGGIKPMLIITMLLAAANLAVMLLNIFGIL